MFDVSQDRRSAAPNCRSHRSWRRPIASLVALSTLVGISGSISGCALRQPKHPPRQQAHAAPHVAKPYSDKRVGRYVVGNPYVVAGMVYVPREEPDYDRVGSVSVAPLAYAGRLTANGERFDPMALVGSHPTLPLPSYVEITNLDNACVIIVRLNDRGPFGGVHLMSISPRAARLLGVLGRGTSDVRLRYLGPAPLNGDTSYEEYFLTRFPSRGCLIPPAAAIGARRPVFGLEPAE